MSINLSKLKILKSNTKEDKSIDLSKLKLINNNKLKNISKDLNLSKKQEIINVTKEKPKKRVQLELKSFYDGTEHFLVNWETGKLFTDEPNIKHIGYVKVINDYIHISYLN
jgi:hypothetical protein